MPELPEVETIRCGLAQTIARKRIKDIWVDPGFQKKLSPSKAKFIKLLRGQRVENIDRLAKLLILRVKPDLFLLIHLKLTGQLVYEPRQGEIVSGGHTIKGESDLPTRFVRLIFTFQDGSRLHFNDLRKFGFMKLVDKKDLERERSKYGVEALSLNFTFEKFQALLNKRPGQKIKAILLNQRIISGLGNIYADESCFLAGIRPVRLVKSLKLAERKRLFQAIKKVLRRAIKENGTSVNTFVDAEGQRGNFRRFLFVYHRAGELCRKCQKTRILKIRVAGRGTSYCPVCQK